MTYQHSMTNDHKGRGVLCRPPRFQYKHKGMCTRSQHTMCSKKAYSTRKIVYSALH